jgi:very-short-patch-repair endonuclease
MEEKGIQYTPQKRISNITVTDFFVEPNVCIFADGDYWHKYPNGTDIDHIRTQELEDKGFKILRLWEHEIKNMNINDFISVLENNNVRRLILEI